MDEIARLRALAEGVAFMVPDLAMELAHDIQRAANVRVDPWLLAGILVEGVAHVIRTSDTAGTAAGLRGSGHADVGTACGVR